MCSSESNNCFQHKSIMSSYICAFNANHTFESLACTQGIHLLHFYYPSHSLIMMKVWKLNLKKCSTFSPTTPCMNLLLPYRINWKWLLDTTWATVCQCLHDFFFKNYCMWQAQRNSEKRKRNSMQRHFKSNSKRQHENQIRIIHFFLCRSEKAPKANIYPLLWVVARPAWLTLNKTQAAGEQAPVFRVMTTENVALNWS